MSEKQYIISENILNRIRSLSDNKQKVSALNESNNIADTNAISITNSPKFGQNVLKSQEDAFKNAVDSGTIFASENETNPMSNPLVFFPQKDGNSSMNMIFSGTIPSMNNLKFQFKLNEPSGNGCFVWTDGLPLSDSNMKTLNKLYGYYLNWKDQWNVDINSLNKMFTNK